MFCPRYLLDGTREGRILLRMGLHWLMLCAIVGRKLRRILSSAVIHIVPFSNFTCHAWVSLLFPRPGTAPNAGFYQNLSEGALSSSQIAI